MKLSNIGAWIYNGLVIYSGLIMAGVDISNSVPAPAKKAINFANDMVVALFDKPLLLGFFVIVFIGVNINAKLYDICYIKDSGDVRQKLTDPLSFGAVLSEIKKTDLLLRHKVSLKAKYAPLPGYDVIETRRKNRTIVVIVKKIQIDTGLEKAKELQIPLPPQKSTVATATDDGFWI